MSNDRRYARLRHTHGPDELEGVFGSNGKVLPVLLGTGTADASRFLRGDGAWAQTLVDLSFPRINFDQTTQGIAATVGASANALQVRTDSNHGVQIWANGELRVGVAPDGRLFGMNLHNNPNTIQGVANDFIASGTFTPAPTNVDSGITVTTYAGWYTRTARVVRGTFFADINISTTGVKRFYFSLPISTNTTSQIFVGGGLNDNLSGLIEKGYVYASGDGSGAGQIAINTVATGLARVCVGYEYMVR